MRPPIRGYFPSTWFLPKWKIRVCVGSWGWVVEASIQFFFHGHVGLGQAQHFSSCFNFFPLNLVRKGWSWRRSFSKIQHYRASLAPSTSTTTWLNRLMYDHSLFFLSLHDGAQGRYSNRLSFLNGEAIAKNLSMTQYNHREDRWTTTWLVRPRLMLVAFTWKHHQHCSSLVGHWQAGHVRRGPPFHRTP